MSTVRMVAPEPEQEPGSRADRTARTRDALAIRLQRLDASHPGALDLTAEVLAAVAEQLAGVASFLSEPSTPTHFREALRGERPFGLEQICKLATDPTKEAGAAVDAALAILARRRGFLLARIEARGAEILPALASMAERGGQLQAAGLRAAADGRYSVEEIDDLERRVRDHEDETVKLRAALHIARKKVESER